MSAREIDLVKETVYGFATNKGFTRKSTIMWLEDKETIGLLQLQRSNYSPLYFMNVGLWIKALEPDFRPTQRQWHMSGRIEGMVDVFYIGSALDPSLDFDDHERVQIISASLDQVTVFFQRCAVVGDIELALDTLPEGHGFWAIGDAQPFIYS